MKTIIVLILCCVPSVTAAEGYRYYRPSHYARAMDAYYLDSALASQRNYYQGYVDAAWYMQQRATVPAVPYYTSPGVLVNPWYRAR